jgi:hypothetical protein
VPDDADDFDDLPPRVEKSKSQSRSKSSKTTSVVSASDSAPADVAPSKASATRKGKGAAPVKDTDTTRVDNIPVSKANSRKAPIPASGPATTHVPPSPPTTASETASETEHEEFDAEERAEYLREEEVVKSNRLQMVEAGAKEAMAVLQNLGSKRINPIAAQDNDAVTPRAVAASAGASGNDDPISLTAEEEEMTVVEYVRRMYALRQAALRAAGEDKIRDWQDKAKQARVFIESIPARDH